MRIQNTLRLAKAKELIFCFKLMLVAGFSEELLLPA
jgi:hypothetical protein